MLLPLDEIIGESQLCEVPGLVRLGGHLHVVLAGEVGDLVYATEDAAVLPLVTRADDDLVRDGVDVERLPEVWIGCSTLSCRFAAITIGSIDACVLSLHHGHTHMLTSSCLYQDRVGIDGRPT